MKVNSYLALFSYQLTGDKREDIELPATLVEIRCNKALDGSDNQGLMALAGHESGSAV